MTTIYPLLPSSPKVIIDTDPGIDDAIAIMVALRSNIDVIGITTVNGNVGAKTGAANTLKILAAMGRLDIPVMKGAGRPLFKRPVHSKDIHGKHGLGSLLLERSGELSEIAASDFIRDTLKNYRKGEVSVIAIGPLTNIAQAIRDPDVASRMGMISIMGGWYGITHKVYDSMTKFAEFNFYCDPEAAKMVMNSGARIRNVSLDVTESRRCSIDARFVKSLGNSVISRMATSLLDFPLSTHGSFHLHDVFAVAALEKPSMFKFKKGTADITLGGKMRGQSRFIRGAGNVSVAVDIDGSRFNEYLRNRLYENG